MSATHKRLGALVLKLRLTKFSGRFCSVSDVVVAVL